MVRGEQTSRPRPCRDDQSWRPVCALGRVHFDAAAADRPVDDSLSQMKVSAAGPRASDVSQEATLGEQEPSVRLEDGDDVIRQAIAGEADRKLRRVEPVTWEEEPSARIKDACDRPAVFRAGVDAAVDDEETLA